MSAAVRCRRAGLWLMAAMLTVGLALPSALPAPPDVASASAKAKAKAKKRKRFVRRGVSYKPYVPPGAVTTGSGVAGAIGMAVCGDVLRADRWPAGRRLARWEAFTYEGGRATALEPGTVCSRVETFIGRVVIRTAGDGHVRLARGWTCDFSALGSTCVHRLPSGQPDLGVGFGPAASVTAQRVRTVDHVLVEEIELDAPEKFGLKRVLVVGSGVCGPSAAATAATMRAAGSLLYADDRMPRVVNLRPSRPGGYVACLFLQWTVDDVRALAVASTTFAWTLAEA